MCLPWHSVQSVTGARDSLSVSVLETFPAILRDLLYAPLLHLPITPMG